jgi:hypothetical protein
MAGSNNFLQFNPTKANQESDATYAADGTRTGGITFDQIMSSLLGNKIFYQASTFISQLAQVFADRGYVVSDANAATLKSVLANIVTQEELLIFRDLANHVHTGTVTTDTIYTTTAPAALGFSGTMVIDIWFAVGAQGASTTTLEITLGWQIMSAQIPTALAGTFQHWRMVIYSSSPTVQVFTGEFSYAGPSGNNSVLIGSLTVNTATAQPLLVKVRNGAVGDQQTFWVCQVGSR